jgi:formylglycine-generating enzyme required for sulfatase activity
MSVDMVYVPGDAFEMGTPREDLPRLQALYGVRHVEVLLPEVPRQRVAVAPFWIAAHPVTNGDYATFLQDRPGWGPGAIDPRLHNGEYLLHWGGGECPPELVDHPVTYVPWYAAAAYAHWAGVRLPSEAEWECAARGGLQGAEFPWGDEPPTPARANYAASGIGTTTRVRSYPPNAWGLYDVAGNVWEYCADLWPAQAEGEAERRVIRGGSYGGAPVNLRVAFRDSHPATGAGPHVGFRCARDA